MPTGATDSTGGLQGGGDIGALQQSASSLTTELLAQIAGNSLWHSLITEITVETGDVIYLTNNYFDLVINGQNYVANSERLTKHLSLIHI